MSVALGSSRTEGSLTHEEHSVGGSDMDVWQLVLYLAASVLALRSLVSLMASHKQQYKRELVAVALAEQKANKKKPPPEDDAEEVKTQEVAAA